MSGGGIGKVFSKVVKVFTQVAPIVLAAAAVVFTAGAGLAAMEVISSTSLLGGGLGAAMSATAGSLGLAGTTAGSVLAGALTSAAYGSAIGGVFSAVSGGNVMKGMQMGALTGAVTGGVTGGFSGPLSEGAGFATNASGEFGATQGAIDFGAKIDPISNTLKDWGSATPAAPTPSMDGGSAVAPAGDPGNFASQMQQSAGLPPTTPAAPSAAATASTPATTSTGQIANPAVTGGTAAPVATSSSGGGLLSGVGDFITKNPSVAGSVVGGVMQGGGNYLAGAETAEAQKQATADLVNGRMAADQAKTDQIAANYSNVQGGGLLTQADTAYAAAQNGTRPTPTQKYDPRAYNGQWVYDSKQGKIVFVQNAATA